MIAKDVSEDLKDLAGLHAKCMSKALESASSQNFSNGMPAASSDLRRFWPSTLPEEVFLNKVSNLKTAIEDASERNKFAGKDRLALRWHPCASFDDLVIVISRLVEQIIDPKSVEIEFS